MKNIRYVTTLILVVILLTISTNIVYAADGLSQLQIITRYPIKSITISGANQYGDGATYEMDFDEDSNTTVHTVFDWWWRFKFFAEVECSWLQITFGGCDDSDFPQPDEISPYVWIKYVDGTLKHKRCTPPPFYSTIANMVTCEFIYDGPEGKDDGGNGPDESSNPDYDSDGDGIPDSQDWCPTIGDEGYGVDGFGCPIPPPDLTVSEASPVQAVYNSNFDTDENSELILNKPLAVRVKLEIERASLIADNQQISIQISLQGKSVIKNFKASEVKDGKYIYLVLVDTPNKSEDGATLSVIVDPTNQIEEDDENNNQKVSSVDVVQAYGMTNAIIRVGLSDPSIDAPSASSVETKMSNEWNPFLEAIYPMAPGEISYSLLSDKLLVNYPGETQQQNVCENIYSTKQSVDLCKLLATIYFQGQSSASGHGRVVGIAESAFFDEVLSSNGFTLSGGLNSYYPSAMVNMGGYNSTLAHELGHTFGFSGSGVDCGTNPPPDGKYCSKVSAPGYWVKEEKPQENTFDFMRYDHPRWITEDRYKTLFNNIFSKSGTPPTYSTSSSTDGVMLAGSISTDGIVSLFGPYYTNQSSFIITGESLMLQTLDIKSNPLTSTGFGTFDTLVKDGDESVNLGVSVFTFTAPFPEKAVYAEINNPNGTIYKTNLHISLLRQAVASLPDNAFVRHPTQTRNTLYNQISALEKQYERANINGVINHLKAIRKYVDLWLLPSYQPSLEIEYSHDKLIELIDELIGRLR